MVAGGLWTDEDLYELSQMVNKFPPGTSDRWQKVAKEMQRPATEVAFMANKMKQNGYKVPNPGETVESVITEEPKKIKTRATENLESSESSSWTQIQQKTLENALVKFPKGSTENRWEKISKCVPNKTKVNKKNYYCVLLFMDELYIINILFSIFHRKNVWLDIKN